MALFPMTKQQFSFWLLLAAFTGALVMLIAAFVIVDRMVRI